MLALGIDTSTPMVSVALVESAVVARQDVVANNAHGEVLAALMSDVLQRAGVTAAEIGVVGVGLGPGPFTGLRVGIVTAAALSDALGVGAYGMCSLDTVTDGGRNGEPYAVVSDARRKQVYWAVYDAAGRRVEGPEIGPPDELAAHLRGRVRRVTGPAAPLLAPFPDLAVTEPQWPDAAVIAGSARDRSRRGDEPGALTPMYLRRPDAREPGPPKTVTPA